MDEFVIAENHMTLNDEFMIVRTLPPYTLINATEGRTQLVDDQQLHQSFAFKNFDGIVEDWTLVVVFSEATGVEAEKILSKACSWYRSYMEWEDSHTRIEEFHVDILEHIRSAGYYSIKALEKAADMPAGMLAKAIAGDRNLPTHHEAKLKEILGF